MGTAAENSLKLRTPWRSPPGEANNRSYRKEISSHLRKPKVHYSRQEHGNSSYFKSQKFYPF
jgi:hypothetical protein